PVQDFRSRQEADAALAQHLPDLALRQFLLKNLEREATGGFHWRINLEALYKHYPEMLKSLEGAGQFHHPTLFIKGGNSAYIHPQDLPTIKTIFSQAQIVTIPHTGHWVHAEAPQEFAKVVLNFLAD
ncbi:MAG: alpha/beta hydrolase, partial [Deltaproteobacteria bacterium]|nr:alpha/beta hydrolase [Deltaproteobacteria bacterium]